LNYRYDGKYREYKIITDFGQAAVTAPHLLSAAFDLDEAMNL